MDKGDGAGMQADAAVGIGAVGPVLEIPFDGTANLGQLDAYLVVSSGLQADLQQVIIL